MATGDTTDILARLRSALPRGWFGNTPILDAVLVGMATALAEMYALYQYVAFQTRIRTATGLWLDIAASDFFGTNLPRLANEYDVQYRARILAALFVEQGTRNAIYYTLLRLTGRAPIIIEPARPADTGAYTAIGSGAAYGLAYGIVGRYGSIQMAYQALVQAKLPTTAGIPLVSGYGVSMGAYNTPSRLEYAQLANAQQNAAIAAIFQAVDAVKPAGTIVWVGPSP
jgi:hypothetical protein